MTYRLCNYCIISLTVDEKADSFPEKDPTVGFREFVKHIDEAAIVKYVTDSILNSTPINVR